jgi:hypothetical protein
MRPLSSSARLFEDSKKPYSSALESKSSIRGRSNPTMQKHTDKKLEDSSKADVKFKSQTDIEESESTATEIEKDDVKETPADHGKTTAPIPEDYKNSHEISTRASTTPPQPESPSKSLSPRPRSPSPSKCSAKIHAQLDQEIINLRQKYNNAISELHSVRAQLAVANDRVGRLSKERNQNAQTIQKLSNDLNEITERYHKAQRQLDKAQSSRLYQEMVGLEARVEQLSERMLERERAFAVASQQQSWLAQSERVEYEAKLNALRMQKKEEIDALNIEIEHLMQSIASQQLYSLPVRSKSSPTHDMFNGKATNQVT